MATGGPLHGDSLLAAISQAMVSLHEQYHGRIPATAKTEMLCDDLLACVLGDVHTETDKMTVELRRTTTVHETGSVWQKGMQEECIEMVERLTGRRVLEFASGQHVGPDLKIELFVLALPVDDTKLNRGRRRLDWR